MKLNILKYGRGALRVVLLFVLFLFWWQCVPFMLSYQEQYQLFIFTTDYLRDALCIPGGFAAWTGEFITQFFYVCWLGALLLALLLVFLQYLVAKAMRNPGWYVASFAVPVMVCWLMADESTLLAYPVAMTMAVAFHLVSRKFTSLVDIFIVPVLYWLIGSMVWLYVALNVVDGGWKKAWTLLLPAAAQGVAYLFLLPEWPLYSVVTGWVYYRIPLQTPTLMWVVPIVTLLLVCLAKTVVHRKWVTVAEAVAVAALLFVTWLAFDNEKMSLIEDDWLVRNEQWDEIIKKATKEQVRTPFSSQCVNLALAKKRQLADRMFDFYQSGRDALIMPRTRDLTSMLPSAEAFWHLGMINSAQRYMFDTQESILNAKKSGRCTKRLAACMIVNGHYQAAAKQLNLLKKSLFYRAWAKEAETYLGKEDKINSHPEWGKKRQQRYKQDFLYNYEELDKMFGQLFMTNTDNKMALDYMLAQMLLNGNVPAFYQYLQWAQQYGGYTAMPLGYQDVVRCMQRNGQVEGSPYLNYVKRITQQQ